MSVILRWVLPGLCVAACMAGMSRLAAKNRRDLAVIVYFLACAIAGAFQMIAQSFGW